jgi:DNA (cytosine-5)-methyltransferase 1
MRYLDVCAGISALTVATRGMGWQAAGYSEIEPFPRAALQQRFGAQPVGWDHRHTPGSNVTPLFGDFTQIEAHHVGPIDLLWGGTPCQDFSVAGLRKGLDGERGNLTLEFVRLADRLRPRWVGWENVPGVLSQDGGRAFGAFLGGLGELGYGFAYRVLDAQFVRVDGHERAVPQRRRRVFVVGHLGDWRRAAAVLFDRESLSGNPAPRREAGEGASHDVAPSLVSSGRGVARTGETRGQDPVVACANSGPVGYCLTASAQQSLDAETETLLAVSHAIRGKGFDASEDRTGRGTPIVPVIVATLVSNDDAHSGHRDEHGLVPVAFSGQVSAVAFAIQERAGAENPKSGPQGKGFQADHAFTLEARNKVQSVATAWAVRRLTPTECHRLQGFPDDHCAIEMRGKPAADGPQYKALGNSMAVNVVRRIARRIEFVEGIVAEAGEMAA